MPQWFRFADALEWVTQNRFNEVQNTQGDSAVGLDPVA
jgi:hypothetical protein